MSACVERNGVHLYKSETLVYEEEKWGIITNSRPDVNTYGTHRCASGTTNYIGYGEYCWRDDDPMINVQQVCDRCGEDVPDSIVTLIRIHNWKR